MRAKKIACLLCAVGAFLLFFTDVENIKSSVLRSLLFCANSLIPSIFIFMIFCSTILYTKAFEAFFDILPKRAFSILGICKKYTSVIFLCSLCGFVNGPKALCEDFEKNGGDKADFSNAVILSSNAGIGFLIGCVGATIWNSISFGIYLFFAQIITSILLGKVILKSKVSTEIYVLNQNKIGSKLDAKISFSSAISRAVSSSALTMISICAFVIFFSCLNEILINFLGFSTNSFGHTILNILSEFCQGSFQILNFHSKFLSAFFSGFCIGFGGICVHFQTFAVCEGYPLDKKKFVIFKLLHGILCGLCALIYVIIFKIEPQKSAISNAFLSFDNPKFSYMIYALLGGIILFFIIKKIFSKIVLIFR